MSPAGIIGSLILLFIVLAGVSAKAVETPYARTCRLNQGQAWTVDLHSKDDLMLCVFNSAAVGAGEFAIHKWNKGTGQSLKAFLSQSAFLNPSTVCQDFRAAQRISQDSEGNPWRLCVFPDNSVIEENTLAMGVNAPSNESLKEALY